LPHVGREVWIVGLSSLSILECNVDVS
jgi:hypothetical protein